MSKFKISCDEATTICDKNQYKSASFGEKLRLTLHLLKCKVCKCYSIQNDIMTKVYEEYSSHQCKEDKCLCDEDKQIMQKALEEQMN